MFIVQYFKVTARSVISESRPQGSSRKDNNNISLDIMKCTNPPNIVQDQCHWSIHSSVQNLPAVLNDPRKAKREVDFFTKTWGDGFIDKSSHVAPNYSLPTINKSHFEAYIHRTSKVTMHSVVRTFYCSFF